MAVGGGYLVDGEAGDRGAVAGELDRFIRRKGYSSADQVAKDSGAPRASIYRWLRGEVSHLYHPENLLKVANTLELSKVETDWLLRELKQPTIDQLAASATSEQQPLFARWMVRTRNNLPAALTSFVGREGEVLDVAGLLGREDVRLVTLTGPGGAGKTRLSLQVAGELHDVFADGIFFVALAAVSDPGQVVPTIARTLEVRDVAGQSTGERLVEYLRGRRMLLVLDNLEQVVAAGPEIVGLLKSAPQVKVLATSRIPLHVTGEHERPVPLLALPDDRANLQRIAGSPAVSLFGARAAAVNADYRLTPENADSVTEICERLDGSPLAIELAAARSRSFAPRELLERFPSRLDLGADGPRDAPQRQRSLRATIDWSYGLLSPAAQTLLGQLSVFSGGWTADAAAAVCGGFDGALTELAEANLIGQTSTGRYWMLETIREYAHERLSASGDEEARRQQHAVYFLTLAEDREPYVPQTRRTDWLERIDREYDNLRAALQWVTSQEHDELTVRLAGALWPYWHEYGRYQEGWRWLEMAIAVEDGQPQRWLGSVYTGALILIYTQGELARAQGFGDVALALWNEIDDRHGMALTLHYSSVIRYISGDYDAAQQLYEETLQHWRSVDQPLGVAACMSELGVLFVTTGRFEEAASAYAGAYEIYEREHDRAGIIRTYLDRGLAAMLQSDLATAIGLLGQGVEMSRQLGDNYHLPWGLFYLGASLCFADELDGALIHFSESLRLRQESGDKYGAAYTLLGFAAVAHRQGQAQRAATLCGAVTRGLDSIGVVMNPVIQSIYTRELQVVRGLLSEGEFDAAFAAGQDMTLDEAVRFALDDPPLELD